MAPMYSITKMCNSKKDVEAVYLFLSDLCSEYSNFRQWYHDTVVPGLANGERLIYNPCAGKAHSVRGGMKGALEISRNS